MGFQCTATEWVEAAEIRRTAAPVSVIVDGLKSDGADTPESIQLFQSRDPPNEPEKLDEANAL
jgi:hypothetical protein